MRLFTTFKTGYTAGASGNTGEYFTTILINGKNQTSIMWSGQFGPEYRVAEVLKAKGYKEFYTRSNYGRLTRADILDKVTYSEYELIKGGKLLMAVKHLRGGSK